MYIYIYRQSYSREHEHGDMAACQRTRRAQHGTAQEGVLGSHVCPKRIRAPGERGMGTPCCAPQVRAWDVRVWDVRVWDVQVWDVQVWDVQVWDVGLKRTRCFETELVRHAISASAAWQGVTPLPNRAAGTPSKVY